MKEKEQNQNRPDEKKDNPGVGNGKENKITVQVRYQSDVVSITINVNQSVTALLQEAIRETGNNSVPKERFQLKFGNIVLDPKGKVNDYEIKEGSLLVLVLTAGGGGNVLL